MSHRLHAESIAGYLRAAEGISSAVVAGTAQEAVRQARAGADLLIVDLRLKDADPPELIEALKHQRTPIPVLALDRENAPALITRAVTAGAAGYCPPDVGGEELVAAILRVASGELVLPDDLVAAVVRSARPHDPGGDLPHLTAREREVLQLLAAGETPAVVARELRIAPNTVRTHLRHAMEKLGVQSQLAAAAWARQWLPVLDADDDRQGATVRTATF